MAKPALCQKPLCTGCEACQSICPLSCITMRADSDGFLHPDIDFDLCIECNKCQHACPVLKRPQLHRCAEPKVFACWHNNDDVRMKSSSGGAFSGLAEVVLDAGGVVFGASYDKQLNLRHVFIDKVEDLDRLRRSKYVQSQIDDCFKQVKEFLGAGRKVLFVGAPCQVAGLHAYLGENVSGLTTVDFICHGVPSPKVFQKYVHSMQKKFKKKFIDIDFRDKRRGWLNNSVVGKYCESESVVFKGKVNSFFNGFILNTFLRPSCYQCPVIGIPRFGQITIADFWGLKRDTLITQNEIDKGISLLMFNDPSIADELIQGLTGKLTLIPRSFAEAKAGNAPMCIPAGKPANREDFFRELDILPYPELAQKYLRPSLKRRVTQFVKENFSTGLIGKVRAFKNTLGRQEK